MSYLSFFFPGVVLMVVLFASIFTTASVIEDRHRGFLQAVQAGPGSRLALVVGKTLGSTRGGAHAGGALPPARAGRRASRTEACAGRSSSRRSPSPPSRSPRSGFAVAWGLDNVQGYHAIQMTVLVPLWVVSGAMFPAPAGHPGFAAAMRANPVAYAVSAARRALAGEGAPGVLPGSAARDLAVCALFAARRARPRRPRDAGGPLARDPRRGAPPRERRAQRHERRPRSRSATAPSARATCAATAPLMLAAVGTSTVFLASYLTRVALTGTHRFPGGGALRVAYLARAREPHRCSPRLAAPLVLRTLFLALRARFPAHRRIARVTLPVWLYVSVTGVLVYAMLYHLAPALR